MKALKWMTMVAILLATSVSLNAQEKQGNQKKHRHMPDSAQMEKRMEKISLELELSEKQQEEFESILAEHRTEVKAAHEQHKPEREKQHAEMESLHADFESDLAKILTPEQKTKYDILNKEHREKRQENKAHKGKGQGNGQQ